MISETITYENLLFLLWICVLFFVIVLIIFFFLIVQIHFTTVQLAILLVTDLSFSLIKHNMEE